ncbi:hypothetical protein SAMN05444004_110108 [Jannaschia faecimaris]|uniref:HEPN domain-containing protein n=1 Tax=Jannaschia faecimaris TaxID=1244108 RepID=A0A1H3S3M1_9RHOB|nr:hypothetical protein SAMN05444004_110108 [Jannaschia faecimaris]
MKYSANAYPGETATKWGILDLAHDYYNCAIHLFKYSENYSGHGMQGPARLCAIHSLELYLNAFLRHGGCYPPVKFAPDNMI